MKSYFKCQGFGLLEVLIAFAIVTVSLVSLVSLQRYYIKAEAAAAVRNGAIHLAESKLDDLRTYDALSTTNPNIIAYNSISTNAGGRIGSGPQTYGSYTYNLTWSNTNNFLTSPANAIPESKNIVITVGWTDADGSSKSLTLSGIISKVKKVDTTQINNSSVASNISPKITYTPGAAPDIISMTLPDGSKKETTKPLPTIKNSDKGLVSVSFDTVTYKSTTKQSLEDFETLSCDCSYTTDAQALTPGVPYVAADGLLYWQVGAISLNTKKRGTSTTSSLCDICCKNHFDGETTTFEEVFNHLNVNPTKYNITGNSYPPAYTSASSGNYFDSCRLMRIDGYYQPLPDWNLVKLIVMSKDFLSTSNAHYDANLSNYQNYVTYIINTYVSWEKSKLLSAWSPPITGSPTILSFDDWYDTNPANKVTGDKMALTMAVTDSSVQLISRGIFVDIMSPNWLTTHQNPSIDISKVPFYDINMTLLTRWHPNNTTSTTDDVSIVKVNNDPMADLSAAADSAYYGVYRRGILTPVKAGSYNITVEAYSGNSAIAAYQPSAKKDEVSVQENPTLVTASLPVIVTGTTTKVKVRGYVYCYDITKPNDKTATACDATNNKPFDLITVSPTTGSVACSLEDISTASAQSLYKYRVFQCLADPGTTFTATFSTTASEFTPTTQSKTLTSSSTDPITYGGCVTFYNPNVTSVPSVCPTSTP